VGAAGRPPTPEQQKRLQDEFKALLVRTYAGALDQVVDQTVTVRPFRGSPDDKEVLVRTEVQGRGDPVQLDYRLEKTPGQGAGWKVYNLNVLGVWLVDTYRTQFAQEINKSGIDGLIAALAARNKGNTKG
jgi:phospholipid transport system substrate-binding protein